MTKLFQNFGNLDLRSSSEKQKGSHQLCSFRLLLLLFLTKPSCRYHLDGVCFNCPSFWVSKLISKQFKVSPQLFLTFSSRHWSKTLYSFTCTDFCTLNLCTNASTRNITTSHLQFHSSQHMRHLLNTWCWTCSQSLLVQLFCNCQSQLFGFLLLLLLSWQQLTIRDSSSLTSETQNSMIFITKNSQLILLGQDG